jgi:hypothetical protein
MPDEYKRDLKRSEYVGTTLAVGITGLLLAAVYYLAGIKLSSPLHW